MKKKQEKLKIFIAQKKLGTLPDTFVVVKQNGEIFRCRGGLSEDQVGHYSNLKEQQKVPVFLSIPRQVSEW